MGKEERMELVGRNIETEMLMNTPRGDFEFEYEVPEHKSSEWEQYLIRHPDLELAVKDHEARMRRVRALVGSAMENIRKHEEELTRYAIEGLSKIPNISIYGTINPEKRVGLVAFNIKGMDHIRSALDLNKYGVEVRSGTHCACLAHRYVGIEGSVRMSFYVYNTVEEIDHVVHAVGKVSRSIPEPVAVPVAGIRTGGKGIDRTNKTDPNPRKTAETPRDMTAAQ